MEKEEKFFLRRASLKSKNKINENQLNKSPP